MSELDVNYPRKKNKKLRQRFLVSHGRHRDKALSHHEPPPCPSRLAELDVRGNLTNNKDSTLQSPPIRMFATNRIDREKPPRRRGPKINPCSSVLA